MKRRVVITSGAAEMSSADAAVFDTFFATGSKNESPQATLAICDKNRNGLVVGEGAGTLILEEYEYAKSRGAKIIAEIVGFETKNMMKKKWFCPNLNLVDLNPEVEPLDYIAGSGRDLDMEYIMSNNFAFSGINTSLIFKNL